MPKYHHVVKINTYNPLAKRDAGRSAARSLPFVQSWARHQSWQAVERCVGYWFLWSQVRGGRAEIIDRGWLPRRTAYDREAEFRAIFGVPVEEWDPTTLGTFLLGDEFTAE